ncbi:MAG: hypothetical protein PHR35_23095 [Kiritimatiellae bacterium]|nr:hypothetical protein [Kiritimatiellia bacterium]
MNRMTKTVWLIAAGMLLMKAGTQAGVNLPEPYMKMAVLWQKAAETSDWLSVYTWVGPGNAVSNYCTPLGLRTSTWQRTSVAIGDGDGDRRNEIWFTEQEQGTHNDRITAYSWEGPNQALVQVFQSDVDSSEWDNISIAVGDADNNGSPDVFTVQLGPVGTVSNADRVAAFTWDGPGHALGWNTYVEQDSGNNAWSAWNNQSVSIGDVNNDGSNKVMIVAHSGNTDLFRFYRWAGPGNKLTSYDSDRGIDTTSWSKIALSIGDANNDGTNEIATVWQEIQYDPRDDEINMFRWTGPGNNPVEVQHALIGSYNDTVNELDVAIGNLDNFAPRGSVIVIR